MKRFVFVLAIVLLSAAVLVPVASGARKTVKVGDNYFRSKRVTVRAGTTVVWKWVGDARHNVYFIAAPRRGKPRNCGARRSGSCKRRLRKRGTYRYVCLFHGSMSGRVTVVR